jgi:hypothetical protein
MSVESAFTYSSHTWLHVLSLSTGMDTIREMPVQGATLASNPLGIWRMSVKFCKRPQKFSPFETTDKASKNFSHFAELLNTYSRLASSNFNR